MNELGLQQWKRSRRFSTITASALSVETGSPLPALKLVAFTSADKTSSRGEVNDLTWLKRELWLELREENKIYDLWKKG